MIFGIGIRIGKNIVPNLIVIVILLSVYIGNKRENINYIKGRFGFKEVTLRGEDFCREIQLVT